MALKKVKAEKKSGAKRRQRPRQAKAGSRGLAPSDLTAEAASTPVRDLVAGIERDGGVALASYRDPLGGQWVVLAALPIERVEPTPYQRDLSDTHMKRLADAIDKLGRFLDPIISVPAEGGKYWTPNGHHRLAALRRLGARTVTSLVLPDAEIARRILVLNTEKAHNLRERSLEVSRLAEGLAALDDRPERDFETEFEEPSLITLGLCYQVNGRFAGGSYHPVVKRVDAFMDEKLSVALKERRARAKQLLALDEAVGAVVAKLKEKGFESPYLKAFVVARVNPIRFHKGAPPPYDEVIEKMLASAKKFDVGKVKADQLAATGGASADE
jgi:ParB family transcriptional regulator, chromosome partitioning protein